MPETPDRPQPHWTADDHGELIYDGWGFPFHLPQEAYDALVADVRTARRAEAVLPDLIDRIKSSAEVSARPGQYDDLYDIAEALEAVLAGGDDA